MKNEWRDVGRSVPGGTKKRLAAGIPVLIWPHYGGEGISPTPFAYFGTRYGDGSDPVFYIYGRQIWPTHWMPLPRGPAGNSFASPGIPPGEEK